MGGNQIKGSEAAVIDLLLAANIVQRNDLCHLGIVKVGDPRIVEGDVAVFANAHNNNVGGIFLQ